MSSAAIESTDARVAHRASGHLRAFNDAGVLSAADVHTALAICRIGRESDDRVALALALTVRALRMGSVCIDLDAVHAQVHDESEAQLDVTKLPWPQPEEWRQAVMVSALVATEPDEPPSRPLRMAYRLLYLERYWQQEELVRRELQERFRALPPQIDKDRLASALHRLFPAPRLVDDETDRQALAAAVAALARVTVLAGGPGTGKTTTVARLLALLNDQPGPPPRIALTAPTGKAAARLAEAVRTAAGQLSPDDRSRLGDTSASTLHRLLGWVPESRGRFRHHGRNRLAHDLVVVDEMSMVSLTMMARLLDALRPEARLVMVGDPDQLSSVEAGAVLADIARAPGRPSVDLGGQLSELGLIPQHSGGPIHGVVQLTHTWRFGGAIDQLAKAIRASDPDAVVAVLRSGASDVVFAEVDVEPARPVGLEPLADQVRRSGVATRKAATVGDVPSALAALDRHRLLCAHRRGPFGVARWSSEVERWLSETEPGYADDGEWYLGRPLLVTANDYELGLFNGDTGVVVDTPDGVRVAFASGAQPTLFAPVRLDAVQTVHAMTVHRAQGSQFDCVSFIVPPPDSPLLTRELLYTAVTRATQRVQVFGSEEAIRRAVLRPANRASGLRSRLG
ncbi:MAG TPA: exodeoxyribonuclease V subunit alpha [Propionibacteriaceae bacterium]|nr:exodeoxyribonuclease V subunit alpha [Propionibacteriaceae bacterium]